MEKLEVLGKIGLMEEWYAPVVIGCFMLIYLVKQFQGLRSGPLSIKRKQFDELTKLLEESAIYEKSGLLLEQVFQNHFGFVLGSDEILHILGSKKQTEAIRDLEYCRSMFKFENNKFVYIRKIKLKTKIIACNIAYCISALTTLLFILSMLTPDNWFLFIFALMFGLASYLFLVAGHAFHSAKRIEDGYYGPPMNYDKKY